MLLKCEDERKFECSDLSTIPRRTQKSLCRLFEQKRKWSVRPESGHKVALSLKNEEV